MFFLVYFIFQLSKNIDVLFAVKFFIYRKLSYFYISGRTPENYIHNKKIWKKGT